MAPTARRLSRRALPLALVAALLACEGDSPGGTSNGKDGAGGSPASTAMLSALASGVVVPTLNDFVAAAEALDQALATHSAASPDAARAAWRAAMVAWQRAELFQFGPAALPPSPGGMGLRDEIYSWPTVNPCAVDQQLTAQAYAAPDFIGKKLVNVYGLDALEYLLFHAEPGNSCAETSSINKDGLWAAISAPELDQRRADYARVVGKGVVSAAKTLAAAWDPASGDFGAKLASAGTSASPYDTVEAAVDAVYAAMFYTDLQLKDDKLAVPLGIHATCATKDCSPELRESVFANHSRENIIANLEGLRLIYLGGPPGGSEPGFEDLLRGHGAETLATALAADIDAAIAAAHAIDGTLAAALADDSAKVLALHAAVKAITDRLKTDVPIATMVNVPKLGKGDAD